FYVYTLVSLIAFIFFLCLVFSFFYSYRPLCYLHSFPTRRSSDLCCLKRTIHPLFDSKSLNHNIVKFNFKLSLFGKQFIFACALLDRKSTRLNSSHVSISYAVFCLKKKNMQIIILNHY